MSCRRIDRGDQTKSPPRSCSRPMRPASSRWRRMRDDPTLYWVEPRERGVIPLDGFQIPKRLARTVRSDVFEVRSRHRLRRGHRRLRRSALRPRANLDQRAHPRALRRAVRCRPSSTRSRSSGTARLVGGLYGVRLGAAFFGESMFHLARDASKVALVHLVARLRRGGFRLLDTQFVTPHLAQFGAVELPRHVYKRLLARRDRGARRLVRLAGRSDGQRARMCWPPSASAAGGDILTSVAPAGRRSPEDRVEDRSRPLRRTAPRRPLRFDGKNFRDGFARGCTGTPRGALDIDLRRLGVDLLGACAVDPCRATGWRFGFCGLLRGHRRARSSGSFGSRDHLRAAFAIDEPDVVDRVLDAVQAGARREHPAGEDAPVLVLERHLVHLDEGRRLGGSRSAAACSRPAASSGVRRTARSRPPRPRRRRCGR